MSRKKREIPVPEPENAEEYICPSASWGDITGLVPFAAENSDQHGSYSEIYPYISEYVGEDKK